MCLAIPMRVTAVDGDTAMVEQEGVTREVRIDFVPEVAVGDYVLVHAGMAIERVDADDAAETLRLMREMADAVR
jgi:hydrogenase expression/formation protein HypC